MAAGTIPKVVERKRKIEENEWRRLERIV